MNAFNKNFRKIGAKSAVFLITIWVILAANSFSHSATHMPAETDWHEGTWLQWPHQYTYGRTYRDRLDETWIQLTHALSISENVHIIAYNKTEKNRIKELLEEANIPLGNIDFITKKTDDVWVRDNGPMFVFDENNNLNVADWGFNGWGFDTPYKKDDKVPKKISKKLNLNRINLNHIVLEGGAIEIDGNGTLMATKSSILEPYRNPGLTQEQLEEVLIESLGVSNFIWLDGAPGGWEDITDMHIDGFARFGDDKTIVTMEKKDLKYWGLSNVDVDRLKSATDINGTLYNHIHLPLTAKNVVTTYGKNLGYKGSYVNYYVANNVVLVPEYQDENDSVAQNILQGLYPGRTVVGIDVRNLYESGGMVHCVTQQQPIQ